MPACPPACPTACLPVSLLACLRRVCAVVQRDARLASVDRPQRERSEVLVRKAEDVAFVADIVAAVTQWMQAGWWVCCGLVDLGGAAGVRRCVVCVCVNLKLGCVRTALCQLKLPAR